jgi:hypothetical protein
VTLLVLGVLFLVPLPSHAQVDSAAVRIRADLATLDKALTVCEGKATELARLLDFTASRPHQVGAEAIKTFQQDLATLTACRTPIQDKLAVIQKAISRPEAESPQDPPPTQPRLQDTFAALQSRMKILGAQMQALTTQLDRLSQGVALPDSTQQPRPGW